MKRTLMGNIISREQYDKKWRKSLTLIQYDKTSKNKQTSVKQSHWRNMRSYTNVNWKIS